MLFREIFLSGINSDPEQLEWTKSPKCYANIYIDDAALGVPLKSVEGFKRRCVDWNEVHKYLIRNGYFMDKHSSEEI